MTQAEPHAKPHEGEHECALDFKAKNIDGKEVDLEDYEGKVVLIVNTASKCGLTPQYAGLQKMYEKYEDKGFVILGFPCNQFGRQEPGSANDIKEFCSSNYSVTFPMFDKVDVNGDEAAPIYKYLTSKDVKPKGKGTVTWNFEKFLIDREGNLIARFEPRTAPDDAELVKAVEAELGK
ncbi:glutathione peroxidase [Stieleria varia]|nr:glutathione peroxidase [Stieleria varia]